MPVFEPPTDDVVPPIYMDRDRFYPVPAISQRLFRHYKSRARGRNVYKLTNGTYTETEPYGDAGVAHTYFGGHKEHVSSTEAAALAAAGYTTYPDPIPAPIFSYLWADIHHRMTWGQWAVHPDFRLWAG